MTPWSASRRREGRSGQHVPAAAWQGSIPSTTACRWTTCASKASRRRPRDGSGRQGRTVPGRRGRQAGGGQDYATLIDAAALLDDPRIAFTIVGEGSEHAALQRRIDARPSRTTVRLAGHIDNPFPTIARAGAFALTSVRELRQRAGGGPVPGRAGDFHRLPTARPRSWTPAATACWSRSATRPRWRRRSGAWPTTRRRANGWPPKGRSAPTHSP